MKALLALEDGTVFHGHAFAGEGEVFGEFVFNTSMTGYQEVLTDPSYRARIVTMPYPLIGNYGINSEDSESKCIQVEAFVVKEYEPVPSNWRSEGSLADYLSSTVWASLCNGPIRCTGHGVGHCGPPKEGRSGSLTSPMPEPRREAADAGT